MFGKKSLTKGSKKLILGNSSATKISGNLSAISNTMVNDPSADTSDQDTQSETALVLGAGSNIIAAFNDSGSYSGSFFSPSDKFTGYAISTDGGASFIDKGTLPSGLLGDAGDPVLARDNISGNIYLTTLSFNSVGEDTLALFRSVDNGNSFNSPVNSTPGFDPDLDSQDKDWIAVDNFAGPSQGYVYEVWRNFSYDSSRAGITLTRSTDGGVTGSFLT